MAVQTKLQQETKQFTDWFLSHHNIKKLSFMETGMSYEDIKSSIDASEINECVIENIVNGYIDKKKELGLSLECMKSEVEQIGKNKIVRLDIKK